MLVNAKENVVTFKNQLKLKIAALTLADCEKCPSLKKFFRNGTTALDRFYIPKISAERYAEIAANFKRTARFNKDNLKLETASDYYIRKARIQNVADMLGVKPSFLDLTDYTWNDDYYTVYSTIQQIEYLDEAWRCNEDDPRNWSANRVYLSADPKTYSLDKELYDMLHHICYSAVISRKAMLLCKVDKCLGFLNSLAEYTNGFKENATKSHVATMNNYVRFFTELLADETAAAWIASTNDVEVFGKNEALHNDYVETYRSILSNMTRGGDLNYFRHIMSKTEDPYLDEILANEDVEVVSEAYLKDVEA